MMLRYNVHYQYPVAHLSCRPAEETQPCRLARTAAAEGTRNRGRGASGPWARTGACAPLSARTAEASGTAGTSCSISTNSKVTIANYCVTVDTVSSH